MGTPAIVAASRDVELIERLAEEGLGGGRHAVGALAEEDDVQVEPEDLLLGELVLHAVGDEGLLQLAARGLVEREEHVARGLHGDGAGALGLVAGDDVDQRGAHHAEVVDAVVLEETVVLGRQEGVLDQLGDLLVGHRDAPLLADLRDQLAAARVDAQRHLQFHVAHRFDRGQRGHQVHITAGERVAAQKCDQHHTPAQHTPESECNSISQKPTLSACAGSEALCIVAAVSRANSPKGGDAKPPVYGTQVPMTAGLPVRTLTHSGAGGHAHARLARFASATQSSLYLPRSYSASSPDVPRTLDQDYARCDSSTPLLRRP